MQSIAQTLRTRLFQFLVLFFCVAVLKKRWLFATAVIACRWRWAGNSFYCFCLALFVCVCMCLCAYVFLFFIFFGWFFGFQNPSKGLQRKGLKIVCVYIFIFYQVYFLGALITINQLKKIYYETVIYHKPPFYYLQAR